MDLTPLLSLISLIPVQYTPHVIAGAALLAMALPAPAKTANPVYSSIYRVVNVLGANAFHAANATAPTAAPPAPTP